MQLLFMMRLPTLFIFVTLFDMILAVDSALNISSSVFQAEHSRVPKINFTLLPSACNGGPCCSGLRRQCAFSQHVLSKSSRNT